MDVLWAEVKTFIPFIRCMSSKTLDMQIKEKNRFGIEGALVSIGFRREPQPDDWQLFCKHAHRVKEFVDDMDTAYLRDDGNYAYQPTQDALKTVLGFIRRHDMEHGPLFPRLATLVVNNTLDDKRSLPEYLPYLCRHSLRSVTIAQRRSSSTLSEMSGDMYVHWKHMMPLIRSAWPNLRSIDIPTRILTLASMDPQIEPCTEIMVPWLETLLRLETFAGRVPLHPSLLYALSKLPLLHTLKLDGFCFDERFKIASDAGSSELSSSSFPSLRKLCLNDCTSTLDSPVLLFQALGSSRTLTHIDISFHAISTAPESTARIQALFKAISQIPLINVLDISLLLKVPRRTSRAYARTTDFVLSGESFSELFTLHHMRDLRLMTNFMATIGDQDLRDAAAAWPNLEKLEFSIDNWLLYPPIPRISLVGAQAFYNGCPNLQNLCMTINGFLPTIEDNGKTVFDISAGDVKSRKSAMEDLTLRFMLPSPLGEYFIMTDILPMAVCIMFPQLKCFTTYSLPGLTTWGPMAMLCWETYSCMEESEIRKALDRKCANRAICDGSEFYHYDQDDYDGDGDNDGDGDGGADNGGDDDGILIAYIDSDDGSIVDLGSDD
ncbi:hypothetical protein BDY19DRAFT_997130 [Irpex rosettiformis]|uniref:Uncharacterized protein n=1 Tax=Irpex rosettiformis TaxID=378272 RepID=A0ACB8TSK7_9APHY|nr:hypothetical protein BDY19DRAFT_997130 [Irpex rosettiformis]